MVSIIVSFIGRCYYLEILKLEPMVELPRLSSLQESLNPGCRHSAFPPDIRPAAAKPRVLRTAPSVSRIPDTAFKPRIG